MSTLTSPSPTLPPHSSPFNVCPSSHYVKEYLITPEEPKTLPPTAPAPARCRVQRPSAARLAQPFDICIHFFRSFLFSARTTYAAIRVLNASGGAHGFLRLSLEDVIHSSIYSKSDRFFLSTGSQLRQRNDYADFRLHTHKYIRFHMNSKHEGPPSNRLVRILLFYCDIVYLVAIFKLFKGMISEPWIPSISCLRSVGGAVAEGRQKRA